MKNLTLKLLTLVLIVSILASCKNELGTGTFVIAVNHYKNVSVGWEGTPKLNYLTQVNNDIGTDKWENGYGLHRRLRL
jgi:hypothetical protein